MEIKFAEISNIEELFPLFRELEEYYFGEKAASFSEIRTYFLTKVFSNHSGVRVILAKQGDEVVGMAVALAGVSFEPSFIIVAFMFFRFFDIWKPFPIRYIDRSFPGGWGIVLDDVAAGIMANLAWRLWDLGT